MNTAQLQFRRAQPGDAEQVLAIIREAQAYFREAGIPQWQNGYPNAATVDADIAAGISHLVLDGDRVVGTSVLQFTPEPTYAQIYHGAWLTGGDGYAAIHRICLSAVAKGSGAAGVFYAYLEDIAKAANVPSVRVDTHEKNRAMRRFLGKCGFSECGIVHMADGAERVAYEKLLG